jgi:feruloyl esterase
VAAGRIERRKQKELQGSPMADRIRIGAVLLATLALARVELAAAASCASLASLDAEGLEVVSAADVGAGQFRPPEGAPGAAAAFDSLPPFCRVTLAARPAAGSRIGIEVWLPSAWNGKVQAVGNGAWAGTISYGALAGAVAAGYAGASTDTGHVGNEPGFALEHPDEVVDFGHRAVHELAVAAKRVAAAFYERAPQAAYFNGCSTGGRQALAAAQRYPADYDGIVAGAPAHHVTHLQATQLWMGLVGARPEGAIEERQLKLVNDAAVLRCDALDGVRDGVIEDPRQCPFDPQELVCGTGGGECLSPGQAATVGMLYSGPRTAAGESLYPGYARGSELGWAGRIGPVPPDLPIDTYRLLVFADPTWDYRSFDVERDVPRAVAAIGDVMNSTEANLGGFVSNGGKLLLYHGWNDPGIPPLGTVRYYEAVRAATPGADEAVRLYMVPGMNHCRGGVGTDTFDPVAALDAWRTSGQPPDRIVAARRENGRTVRTRPLCPFPAVAVYRGTGSTDEETSFACRVR